MLSVVEGLRLENLPHSEIILKRLLCDHQLLLLHIMLELLVKAVQSMNEFVLALLYHSPLRTQLMRLMHKLLAAHELTLLVGVIVVEILTAYRVIVGVDLDVLQTLTAQRDLMIHNGRTL